MSLDLLSDKIDNIELFIDSLEHWLSFFELRARLPITNLANQQNQPVMESIINFGYLFVVFELLSEHLIDYVVILHNLYLE